MNILFEKHEVEELTTMKKAAKFEIIKTHCDNFRGIFKDFIEDNEDKENVLHQFAIFFGNSPSIENCFDTIVQYFWTQEQFLSTECILDWSESAQKVLARRVKEEGSEEEANLINTKEDSEGEDQDENTWTAITSDKLKLFLSNLEKLVNHLKGIKQAEEDA